MCAFSVIYTSNEPAFVVDYAINPNQVFWGTIWVFWIDALLQVTQFQEPFFSREAFFIWWCCPIGADVIGLDWTAKIEKSMEFWPLN